MPANSKEPKAKVFVHASTHYKSNIPKGADIGGRRCLYVVGPNRRHQKFTKPNVFLFKVSDEVDDFDPEHDDYLKRREELIRSWDDEKLLHQVNGIWVYRELGNREPQIPLNDTTLKNELIRRIERPEHAMTVAQLLHAIAFSPYNLEFEVEELRRSRVDIRNDLKSLMENEGFTGIQDYLDFDKLFPEKFRDLYPACVRDLIVENCALALDIESDGDRIFQIGWYNPSTGYELRTGLNDDPVKLEAALHELAEAATGRLIVGHNLIQWDLPILEKKCKTLINRIACMWDTVLFSWVLEPWKENHALTSSDRPHEADADAKASFDLFTQQLNRLSPSFIVEYLSSSKEHIDFGDYLVSELPNVENRVYPSIPPETEKALKDKYRLVLVPEWRLADHAWCPGVRYAWPATFQDTAWRVLSPQSIYETTKANPESIWLSALAAVVLDADANSVQVTLSMLPVWMRQRTERFLSKCLVPGSDVNSLAHDGNCCISSYRAWRDAPSEEAHAVFDAASTVMLFAQEAEFEWLRDPKPLKAADVQDVIGVDSAGIEAETILSLDDSASVASLTHLAGSGNYRHWLLFNPARKQAGEKVYWTLCSRQLIPSPSAHSDGRGDSDDSAPLQAAMVAWQTPGNSPSPLLRDFVPPSSGNRLAYWQDAISRLLSIARIDDSTLVLLLQNHCEVDAVREALAAIEQTTIVADSVLRQLEAVHRSKRRIAVDTIENAHQWLVAAEKLQCEVQLVVESLPLHLWWMCLDQSETSDGENGEPSADAEDEGATGEEDGAEAETEHNVDVHADDAVPRADASPAQSARPVTLSRDAVELCTRRFLNPWLAAMLRMEVPARPPIILDSRLDSMRLDHLEQARRRDVAFCPLSKTEDDRLLYVLRDSFGDLERSPAPTAYEAYQGFLRQHWGYQDFKLDTQKPAIDAIRENNADVLVRLPTGEGKSVLFQIPALLRGAHTKRLTIVLTPLRALMADQVRTLWGKGFFQSVDYLSADRDRWVTDEVYQGVIDNRIKLLFVAPERFRVERFRDAIQRRYDNDQGFEYLVVDEAHCVSQWGFEFRPDYLFAMEEIRNVYRRRADGSVTRLLFFSATVTEAVRISLEQEAGIEAEHEYTIVPKEQRHPVRDFIRLHTEDTGTALYGNGLGVSRVGEITHIINDMDLTKSAVIIFVTRRRHAEELSYLLYQAVQEGTIKQQHARVRYFHAGLPALERLEVYEELSAGQVNVLVATKAFGMGMDIPHIHACVHLAPPSYLEDYLQEVGRTGRGEKERAAAGLQHVDCTLLYDRSDFDENHTKIQENKTTPPVLDDLWGHIGNLWRPIAGTERRVCILPTDGVKNLKPTPLRRALFWLERSGRLQIRGFLPGLLRLRLKKATLEQVGSGQGEDAVVARALLALYEEPTSSVPSSPAPASADGRVDSVLSFAKGILGILFGPPPAKEQDENTEQQEDLIVANVEGEWDEAEIQLNSIWQRTDLPRVDDVLRALSGLQRNDAVQIAREIEFEAKPYLGNQAQMWKWLNLLLDELLKETPETGKEITPDLLSSLLEPDPDINPPVNWTQQMARAARKRAVRSTIKLCAAASVRIREQVNDAQELIYHYSLAPGRVRFVRRRIGNLCKLAQAIEAKLSNERTLSLSDILACCEGRGRIKDVGTALRLISNLGLYTNKQELLAYSYVIEVLNPEPLAIPTDCAEESDDHSMFEELKRVNRMAELRAHAMALYSLLPDELRKKYVDDYFMCATPEALEELLGSTYGAVDETVRVQNDFLNELMGRLRGQALTDRIDGNTDKGIPALNDNQKLVCTHPYGGHLMVNAGPGAGKTHVLMLRCAHLIHAQNIRPHEILVLAFNRAVVHEIRQRITRLFTDLGYGSYVRRLHVYTFHAFALKTLGKQDVAAGDDETLQELLHRFAETLESSPTLQSDVSGYKAVLVDEFQDMNNDFYRVILAIQRASGAGLMIIGDDDQDILLWNRLQWEDSYKPKTKTYRHACQYFDDYGQRFDQEPLALPHNYRSGTTIVKRSQSRAVECMTEFCNQLGLARMKQGIELIAARTETGRIGAIPADLTLAELSDRIVQQATPDKSVAVLCRSNAEVFDVYGELRSRGVAARVQSSGDLRLSTLRGIAEWLDLCRNYLNEQGDPVLDEDLESTLVHAYRSLRLPDRGYVPFVHQLWQFTLAEGGRRHLSDHVAFLDDLRTSDYTRMAKRSGVRSTGVIVSTIHKVKGLEFDSVFVKASCSSFPLRANAASLVDHAFEEARLYYVAMTRARDELFLQWGEREKRWKKAERYDGVTGGQTLEGSPGEVFLSWPGYSQQFNQGLQEYIRKSVRKGDRLTVQGGRFKHNGRAVGRLSGGMTGGPNSDVYVVAVYRSVVAEEVTPPNIYTQIHPYLQDQGWLYTVLVRGGL